MPIETIDRWVPPPPISMKLTTALHVLCMILSEPAATACMPGETPIETVSISTPLAAKKPFLVATIPGHIVAVGETWPKETLVADCAGATANVITCSETIVAATLNQGCIRNSFDPNPIGRPLSVVPAQAGTHIPEVGGYGFPLTRERQPRDPKLATFGSTLLGASCALKPDCGLRFQPA